MQVLPIDVHIPEILKVMKTHHSCVLLSPPGTGKTTRIPRALLDHFTGEVIVLQPRRVAAKLSAKRVASELGQEVGGLVGYQFRFENITSKQTRLKFMTEGTFTRRLLNDQTLKGVSVIILDEFHERHLHTDFALSALRAIQKTSRPDLKIMVMSATIDPDAVAKFLGASVYRVETRAYPVELIYEASHDEVIRNLKKAVASVKDESTENRADILVFLAGQREIDDAARALEDYQKLGFQIIKFYSAAPDSEQKKAVTPEGPRKIILATNIAETSITIEGVTTVIDSGLAKVPSFSWWSGLPQLKLQKISKASAVQRAGRAGRTGPGKCIRLYARQDFDSRPAYETPEVARSDLTMTLLELAELNLPGFEWFEAPPENLLEASRRTLELLKAIQNNKITPWGQKLAELPLHPRLSSMVLYAAKEGAPNVAALAAALLSSGGVEGEDLIEYIRKTQNSRPSRAVAQAQRQILESLKISSTANEDSDEVLAQCFLQGFPDRVAQRSPNDNLTLNLCLGGSVTLRDRALADSASYFILPEVDEVAVGRNKKIVARAAVGIEPEWLIDLDLDILKDEKTVRWNQGRQKVEEVSAVKFGTLVLSESVQAPSDKKLAACLLIQALKDKIGPSWLTELAGGEKVNSVLKRLDFLKSVKPVPKNLEIHQQSEVNIENLLEDFIVENFKKWNFDELKAESFGDFIIYGPLAELTKALDAHLPEFIQLGKRKVPVNYSTTQPPWVESRIQDFFGIRETPKILSTPLTLHLLAPNKRAVQVTQDLSGFWTREYPRLRVELGRRYPRHPWPESPY